jgi:protein gp37
MGPVTDLFGDWRTTEDMGNDIIHAAIHGWDADATYLWLTKRVGNMGDALKLASRIIREHWFHNHYFGFTAENQEWYDKRLSEWTKPWTNALKHINWWLSCEPLLGPINLHFYTYWNLPSVVIVGCESGSNRRPCKIEWVESIVEQCRSANVPVFVKQICLPNGRFTNKIEEFPEHLRIRQVPWAKVGAIE